MKIENNMANEAEEMKQAPITKMRSVHPNPVSTEQFCMLRYDGKEAKIPILTGKFTFPIYLK